MSRGGIKYTNCVCFACKTTARRVYLSDPATCPDCREKMTMLHYDVQLPKKKDKKGWKKLQSEHEQQQKDREEFHRKREAEIARYEIKRKRASGEI